MAATKKDFEKFYHSHIDKVYRFVFFRCQDKNLAEDLVSEIFLKALEHFDSYDENRSKSAWLMTITKNHLANYWRDRKPTVSLDSGNDEDFEGDNDAQWLKSAIFEAQKQTRKNMVYEILAKLKPEERDLVTLHYLFGYSYAEIGKMKGMSEGAVKVAAHRVVKKMHALI